MSSQRPHFVRLLYTQNPFYVISACLVLAGAARALARVPGDAAAAQAAASVLAGYALVLSATGGLLVRRGVWDDARSVVLVILLQLAVLSACFDQLSHESWMQCAAWQSGGLLLAVGLSELMLRWLRLPFGPLWRTPYYAMLTLLFAAPLWASPTWHSESVAWRVLAFPAAGALAVLSLLPAVARGHAQATRSKLPWKWPFYPGAVFVLLIVCLAGRSCLLSYSFVVADGWETVFAPYFLLPLAWAAWFVLLQCGLTGRRGNLSAAMLLAGPALLLLTGRPPGELAAGLYDEVTRTLGSPAWLACGALGLSYGWAWLRGAAAAEVGVWGAALGALVAAGPDAAPPVVAAPVVLLAAYQLAAAWRQARSPRFLAGGLLLALTAGWWWAEQGGDGRAAAAIGAAAAVLAAGVGFDDALARRLRLLSGLLLAGLPWGAVAAGAGLADPPLWTAVACGAAGGALGWLRFRERWWLLGMESGAVAAGAALALQGGGRMRSVFGPDAAAAIIAGLAMLGVAVAISATKAGLGRPLSRWLRSHFASQADA